MHAAPGHRQHTSSADFFPRLTVSLTRLITYFLFLHITFNSRFYYPNGQIVQV